MIADVATGAGTGPTADPISYARAILNILEDFSEEKTRLGDSQKAMLNILEDFDVEKNKAEQINREMAVEISERKRAEQQLETQRQELARSNKELELFAYVASHDLQEPLRMVTSYVQLLEQRYKGQLDEKAEMYIHYAVDGATRMRELINNLLEYSRVGKREISFRTVDCNAVLDRVLQNLAMAIRASHAVVTRDRLPTVIGEESQLVQLFQNLVGNAVKFCNQGPPRIHASAQQKNQEWVFSVRDNGIGIEPAYDQRIFQIFQRLHGQEYSGTGIGLAITQKIVERHGGRIWVESELGKGSTFYFTIPMKGAPNS